MHRMKLERFTRNAISKCTFLVAMDRVRLWHKTWWILAKYLRQCNCIAVDYTSGESFLSFSSLIRQVQRQCFDDNHLRQFIIRKIPFRLTLEWRKHICHAETEKLPLKRRKTFSNEDKWFSCAPTKNYSPLQNFLEVFRLTAKGILSTTSSTRKIKLFFRSRFDELQKTCFSFSLNSSAESRRTQSFHCEAINEMSHEMHFPKIPISVLFDLPIHTQSLLLLTLCR